MELDELSSTISTRSKVNEFKIKGKRMSISPKKGTETLHICARKYARAGLPIIADEIQMKMIASKS
jgi:hypothetical protein